MGLLGVAEGSLRIAQAMFGDVARTLDPFGLMDGAPPEDWLDARDSEYIDRALPAIRAWSDLYFRAEVHGLEEIPADEPVLLVGNHSGGTLIADTFVFSQHFYDHFGAQRRFHQLAHDLVFRVPGMRAGLCRFGTVPASPHNMRRALDRGAALLVYPGGDQETYRPTWEQDQIDFAGRTGFVKLALELGTPIVPVVAIGGQETALFLGRGRRVSRAGAGQGAAAEGLPGPARAAVRADAARPPVPGAAAGEDHDPRAAADRPARGAGRAGRSCRRLPARH